MFYINSFDNKRFYCNICTFVYKLFHNFIISLFFDNFYERKVTLFSKIIFFAEKINFKLKKCDFINSLN